MFSNTRKYDVPFAATPPREKMRAAAWVKVLRHWWAGFSTTQQNNVHPIHVYRAQRQMTTPSRRSYQPVHVPQAKKSPSFDIKIPSSMPWRIAIGFVVILMIAVSSYLVPKWLVQFPIRQVAFSGTVHYVMPEQVKAAVDPFLAKGFFLADLSAIQKSVSEIPWVDTADVKRQWPATLRVVIAERIPIAVWNGEYLVSNKGELFKPESLRDLSATLPRLSGALSQSWLIMKQYQTVLALLRSQQLTLKTFGLSPYASWEMTLNNDIVIHVDHEHFIEKMQRFIEVYPRLKSISQKIAYVDLRYQKGMAIGWRK